MSGDEHPPLHLVMTSPPEDDDRTVVRPGRSSHSSPASVSSTAPVGGSIAFEGSQDGHALRIGTRLGEFELIDRLGEGGFSIVYLARDHSLDRNVAFKEYMPSSIAVRLGQTQVGPRSERHRETFDLGLRSFVNEAKLLAQFDHPSLVKVYRFWEANGTAYMVMPFYEGMTVRDTVRSLAQPPDETWLLGLLGPLTEALAVIHAEGCYHRDIAPDNVILLAGSGKPLLLDFGAARRVIGNMTQTLTVILKPGYAPVEQYAEVPGMKQGPWTDVYALAAVVCWAITGKTPPPSVGRMLRDSYVPLAECAAGRYSQAFLQAIDRALVVLPELRTQTIDALRLELGLSSLTLVEATPPVQEIDSRTTPGRPLRTVSEGLPGDAQRSIAGAVDPAVASAGSAPQTSVDTPGKPGRLRIGLVMATAGAVVIATGLWWKLRSPSVESLPPSPVVENTATPTVPAAPTTPAAPQPKAPEAPPVPMAAPAVLRSPTEALVQLAAGSDPSIKVMARAFASTLAAGQDALRLSVTTSEAGYLYIVGHRAGSDELVLLHPASLNAAQRIDAHSATQVVPSAWHAAASSPGAWRLAVWLARHPRDFARAGWHMKGRTIVRGFGREAAPAPAAAAVWGAAACEPGAAPCDNAYGFEELEVGVIAAGGPAPMAKEAAPKPAPSALDRKPARTPKTAEAPQPERRAQTSGNTAECARILQRLSLGESAADLMQRAKTLGCR